MARILLLPLIALLSSFAAQGEATAAPFQGSTRELSGEQASLLAQSSALSERERADAKSLFSTGFELWQSGDFGAAELAFEQGLRLDPANAAANYYFGDSIRRRDRVAAIIYLERAVAFGGSSAEAFKARAALETLSRPVGLAEMSAEDLRRAFIGEWEYSVQGGFWNTRIRIEPNGADGIKVSGDRSLRNAALQDRSVQMQYCSLLGGCVTVVGQLTTPTTIVGTWPGVGTWSARKVK